MKPWTFMNRSGQSVATAVGFYKMDLRDLMVVVDDMALETGALRVRSSGSAGGHNGLADILRFGVTPLTTRFIDVWDAVERLREVLDSGQWREPRFNQRGTVT